MGKVALDLSALRVESFAAAPAPGAAGTVLAHELTIGLNCPETNYRTCPHTCAAGCRAGRRLIFPSGRNR